MKIVWARGKWLPENCIQQHNPKLYRRKNVYDPLRTNPENIPIDLQNLILQAQILRQRAIDEINALSTQEEAIQYIIKGEEVENYINMLKSFL